MAEIYETRSEDIEVNEISERVEIYLRQNDAYVMLTFDQIKQACEKINYI
jgi:hypothetical protein